MAESKAEMTFAPGYGRLKDKVAIVTGGSSGLGREICTRYAAEGARVVVADIREESRAPEEKDVKTVDKITAAHGDGRAVFARVDTTSAEDVERVVAETVARWGRLDIMVNNAGSAREGSDPRPVWELSDAAWAATLAVNTTGVMNGVRAAARVMIAQDPFAGSDSGARGWIVNTASILGLVAVPGSAAYNTSKHAVMGLTKTAALDCAPFRVHVNAICPGFVDTALIHDDILADQEQRTLLGLLHPLGGLGSPKDIAGLAVMLASEDARWMTGQGLIADGGYTIR